MSFIDGYMHKTAQDTEYELSDLKGLQDIAKDLGDSYYENYRRAWEDGRNPYSTGDTVDSSSNGTTRNMETTPTGTASRDQAIKKHWEFIHQMDKDLAEGRREWEEYKKKWHSPQTASPDSTSTESSRAAILRGGKVNPNLALPKYWLKLSGVDKVNWLRDNGYPEWMTLMGAVPNAYMANGQISDDMVYRTRPPGYRKTYSDHIMDQLDAAARAQGADERPEGWNDLDYRVDKQASLDGYMTKVSQESWTADDFLQAVRYAETKDFKDPWIRTTHMPTGGSSAYGPLQIGRKALDLRDKHSPYYAGKLLDKKIVDRFLDHQKKLLYHGGPSGRARKDYNPIYDYGGSGNYAFSPQLKQEYWKLGRHLVNADFKRSGGDVDKFIKYWYATDDPEAFQEYKDRFMTRLGQIRAARSRQQQQQQRG
jgi:hypothetical protein